MTDDYNLAKPDPQTGLPPYMVDVNLPDGDAAEHLGRRDHTGFVAGQDRMLSAPEFLAREKMEPQRARRGHLPFDGPSADLAEENARLRAEVLHLSEALTAAVRPVNGETSDGYHTFDELYDHRRALTAALAEMVTRFVWMDQSAWRSRNHHPLDSAIYDGYFIVGIDLPTGTVTYHYNNQYWDDFKNVPEVEHAPKWDGAGPEATVTRLIDFARGRD